MRRARTYIWRSYRDPLAEFELDRLDAAAQDPSRPRLSWAEIRPRADSALPPAQSSPASASSAPFSIRDDRLCVLLPG